MTEAVIRCPRCGLRPRSEFALRLWRVLPARAVLDPIQVLRHLPCRTLVYEEVAAASVKDRFSLGGSRYGDGPTPTMPPRPDPAQNPSVGHRGG